MTEINDSAMQLGEEDSFHTQDFDIISNEGNPRRVSDPPNEDLNDAPPQEENVSSPIETIFQFLTQHEQGPSLSVGMTNVLINSIGITEIRLFVHFFNINDIEAIVSAFDVNDAENYTEDLVRAYTYVEYLLSVQPNDPQPNGAIVTTAYDGTVCRFHQGSRKRHVTEKVEDVLENLRARRPNRNLESEPDEAEDDESAAIDELNRMDLQAIQGEEEEEYHSTPRNRRTSNGSVDTMRYNFDRRLRRDIPTTQETQRRDNRTPVSPRSRNSYDYESPPSTGRRTPRFASELPRENLNRYSPFDPPRGTPDDSSEVRQLRNPLPSRKLLNRGTLSPKIKWDGKRGTFQAFKHTIEGHFLENNAPHIVELDFLQAYRDHGSDVIDAYPDLNLTNQQLAHDSYALYGALTKAGRNGAARHIMLKYEKEKDGFLAWLDILHEYDHDGNRHLRQIEFDDIIQHRYHSDYPGGLEQFAMNYTTAYAELEALGFNHSDIERRARIIQNLYTPDTQMLCDYVEKFCKTFAEVVQAIKEHAQRNDFYDGRSRNRGKKSSKDGRRLIPSTVLSFLAIMKRSIHTNTLVKRTRLKTHDALNPNGTTSHCASTYSFAQRTPSLKRSKRRHNLPRHFFVSLCDDMSSHDIRN